MTTRCVLVIYYVALILLCVPVWYNLTKTQRSNVPQKEMTKMRPETFPRPKYEVTVLAREHIFKTYRIEEFTEANTIVSFSHDNLSASFEEQLCNLYQTLSVDEFEEFLSKQENSSSIGKLKIYAFLCPSNKATKVFFGKSRIGWIMFADSNEKTIATVIRHSVRSMFISKTDTNNALPVLSHIIATFSLLSANGTMVLPSWDFTTVKSMYLEPFIQKVKPIVEISVESQVLHFVKLRLTPTKIDNGFGFHSDSLFQLLDANWKFDFSPSFHPVLNFVLLCFPENMSPIYILDKNDSSLPQQSYIVPQWGGVYLMSNATEGNTLSLTNSDLNIPFRSFVYYHRLLLGVPDIETEQISVNYEKSGFITDWEIDVLMLKQISAHLNSSRSTLSALGKLLEEVSVLKVTDQIAETIKESISLNNEAIRSIQEKDYLKAIRSAKAANQLSDKAFYAEEMLSLLYYAKENTYAIYLPFFFPFFCVLTPKVFGMIRKTRKKVQDKQ